MEKKARETYGIYLPGDTEQWFRVTFTSQVRARWFAEANDLGKEDCDIRLVSEVEVQKAAVMEPEQKEAA